jgi:N-succinyldiaminopimelate aminotransferase
MTTPSIPGFRPVPFTGVIYVMAEAARRGFRYGHPEWCNLGQGQPETGPLPGAPPRVRRVEIGVDDQEYAPVPGIWELRRAVAELYNELYRKGKRSQYTERNVCICGGGRASLTRAVAALGEVNLGHFLPDYTAYEELLDIFKLFTSIPILLSGDTGYHFGLDELEREITGRGLSALLLSNPCNPTGKVIQGDELDGWVGLARDVGCTLLIDEFYSHYIWTPTDDGLVSAARHVDDVDADPVVLFDGLTKNWRYPGWRTTWIVGPQPVIEAVSSSGSFLDGGGSKPLQRSAVPLLEPALVRAETAAIRETFLRKRGILGDGLRVAGVRFDVEPEGTFY